MLRYKRKHHAQTAPDHKEYINCKFEKAYALEFKLYMCNDFYLVFIQKKYLLQLAEKHLATKQYQNQHVVDWHAKRIRCAVAFRRVAAQSDESSGFLSVAK
jgi:hypothetical protein